MNCWEKGLWRLNLRVSPFFFSKSSKMLKTVLKTSKNWIVVGLVKLTLKMREHDYKPLYKHAQSSISKAQQISTSSPKNVQKVHNSKCYKAATCWNEQKKKKKQFCVDSSFYMKLYRPQRTFINCSEKVFWRLNLRVSLVFK